MKSNEILDIHKVKNENYFKVLRLICCERDLARVSLANKTGLTKMTITNIVNNLIANAIVEEDTALSITSSGPKPMALKIAANAPLVLGIAIRRKRIGAVVSTLDMNILREKYLPFDYNCSPGGIITICKQLIAEVIDFYKERIAVIGITSPGPIDKITGTILNPPKLFAFNNLNIIDKLSKEFNITMFLQKDTNAACLLEKNWGNGRNLDKFALVAFSTGLGMCVSNEIDNLNSSYCGEIGHMTINYDGDSCGCGKKGCLEIYSSCEHIIDGVQQITGKTMHFSECIELYSTNSGVKKIIDENVHFLAVGLANANNLFSPQTFIIGAQGYDFPDDVLSSLESQINKMSFGKPHNNITVLRSKFGRNCNLYGSAAYAIEKFIQMQTTDNQN